MITLGAKIQGLSSYSVDITGGDQTIFRLLGPLGCWVIPHKGGGSCSIILGNGLVQDADPSKQAGYLTGTFNFQYGGFQFAAPFSLHDGCFESWDLKGPAPAIMLPEAYQDFILEGWDSISLDSQAKIIDRLKTQNFTFDDAKFTNPDQSGSPRVVQSQWAGAVAYALGYEADRAIVASRAFARQQGRRPMLYFTADGKLIDRKDIWIEERGFRKSGHGKWARFSASPYALEDNEHLAPDRFFLAAAAGDPVAEFVSQAYINALCTRPSLINIYPTQQARAVGYLFETLAKRKLIAGDPGYKLTLATQNLLTSLLTTHGYGGNISVPFMAMWPPTTIHTTHVGPTIWDAQEFAEDHELTLPQVATVHEAIKWLEKTLGTSMLAPVQLQWLLRGVTIWGTAIIRRGLGRSRNAGLLLSSQANQLIADCGTLIQERGAKPGILAGGTWVMPDPLHESVAPRCNRVYADPPGDGTSRYCVPGLLLDTNTVLRKIANRLYTQANTFKLSDPSLAAIEIAGLPAIAEFGLR